MTEGVHSDSRVPSLEADFDGGGPGERQGSGGRRFRDKPGMTKNVGDAAGVPYFV